MVGTGRINKKRTGEHHLWIISFKCSTNTIHEYVGSKYTLNGDIHGTVQFNFPFHCAVIIHFISFYNKITSKLNF